MIMRSKKGIIIPRGTEQETGLTRGKTEKPKPENAKSENRNEEKDESKIIPAGTQQETGFTLPKPRKSLLKKKR